jgi:VCBS repeat-containing protein
MKKALKLSGLITVLILTVFSCKKDVKLPSDAVTTYVGSLAYTPTIGSPIANTAGTATISGSKGNYSVSFSNSVPSLTGLKFDKESGGSYATQSEDGSTTGITINDKSFNIAVVKSDGQWAFSGVKQ